MNNKKNGMGSHQSCKMLNDEWLTPPWLLKALGKFDLDPCSPINRPWDTAKKHYTKIQNGLIMPWRGRVFCNPPYGKETIKWLKKCAEHKNVSALIFARTETEMFFKYVWDYVDSVLFIKGRLYFYNIKGERAKSNSGAPSILLSYNKKNTKYLKRSNIPGKILKVNNNGKL